MQIDLLLMVSDERDDSSRGRPSTSPSNTPPPAPPVSRPLCAPIQQTAVETSAVVRNLQMVRVLLQTVLQNIPIQILL